MLLIANNLHYKVFVWCYSDIILEMKLNYNGGVCVSASLEITWELCVRCAWNMDQYINCRKDNCNVSSNVETCDKMVGRDMMI